MAVRLFGPLVAATGYGAGYTTGIISTFSQAGISGFTEFTVCGFFNATGAPNGAGPLYTPLFEFSQANSATGRLGVQITNAGLIQVFYGATPSTVSSSTTMSFGQWYFVALTMNSSSNIATVYTKLVGSPSCAVSTANVGAISTLLVELNIGNDHISSSYGSGFYGSLSSIKFWTKGLSQVEIEAESNQLAPANTQNLVGYWPLDREDNLSNSANAYLPLSYVTELNSGSGYSISVNNGSNTVSGSGLINTWNDNEPIQFCYPGNITVNTNSATITTGADLTGTLKAGQTIRVSSQNITPYTIASITSTTITLTTNYTGPTISSLSGASGGVTATNSPIYYITAGSVVTGSFTLTSNYTGTSLSGGYALHLTPWQTGEVPLPLYLRLPRRRMSPPKLSHVATPYTESIPESITDPSDAVTGNSRSLVRSVSESITNPSDSVTHTLSVLRGYGNPANYSGLMCWHDSQYGVTTIQGITRYTATVGTVVATGTSPPAVTITGTPLNTTTIAGGNQVIEIDITTGGTLGTALFTWKLNGSVIQTNQTTASTFTLGTAAASTTGLTANFPAGTYTNDNVYTETSSAPASVWLTGTATSSNQKIEIDITTGGALGTALFTWKLNGSTQATGQTTAATYVLGTTGMTANFGPTTLSGTATIASGTPTVVTGTGTSFLTQATTQGFITFGGTGTGTYQINGVNNNTTMSLLGSGYTGGVTGASMSATYTAGDVYTSVTCVSQWKDISGSGDTNRNAVNSNGTATLTQPTYISRDTTFSNSVPSIFFDRSPNNNRYLNHSNWSTPAPIPCTIFAVGYTGTLLVQNYWYAATTSPSHLMAIVDQGGSGAGGGIQVRGESANINSGVNAIATPTILWTKWNGDGNATNILALAIAGTVSLTNGSATVTGSSTTFLSQCSVGQNVTFSGGTGPGSGTYTIATIASNTSMTLSTTYGGTGTSGSTATMQWQGLTTVGQNGIAALKSGNVGASTSTAFTIGSYASGSATSMNGAMVAFLVYNRTLAQEEIQAIGGWLSNKYGMTFTGGLNPTLQESITDPSDSVSNVQTHTRALPESITNPTLAVARAFVGSRSISDSIVDPSDSVARHEGFARALSESVTDPSDTVSRVAAYIRGISPPWTWSGCVAAYESSQGVGISGSTVTGWNDLTSNGVNLTAGTLITGNNLSYSTSGGPLTGIPFINFQSGSGHAWFNSASNTGVLPSGDAQFTVVSVMIPKADGTAYTPSSAGYWGWGNDATKGKAVDSVGKSGTLYQMQVGAQFGAYFPTTVSNTWHLFVHTRASGNINTNAALYIDGTSITNSGSDSVTPLNIDGTAPLAIGTTALSNGATNTYRFSCIAGFTLFMIFNRVLSTSELNQLGGWVQTAYGITVSGATFNLLYESISTPSSSVSRVSALSRSVSELVTNPSDVISRHFVGARAVFESISAPSDTVSISTTKMVVASGSTSSSVTGTKVITVTTMVGAYTSTVDFGSASMPYCKGAVV